MSRRNKAASPDRSVGYGYVGRWNDGRIGWFLPCFTSHPRRSPAESSMPADYPDPVFLCRVTVEVVRDSRGRAITRRAAKYKRGGGLR